MSSAVAFRCACCGDALGGLLAASRSPCSNSAVHEMRVKCLVKDLFEFVSNLDYGTYENSTVSDLMLDLFDIMEAATETETESGSTSNDYNDVVIAYVMWLQVFICIARSDEDGLSDVLLGVPKRLRKTPGALPPPPAEFHVTSSVFCRTSEFGILGIESVCDLLLEHLSKQAVVALITHIVMCNDNTLQSYFEDEEDSSGEQRSYAEHNCYEAFVMFNRKRLLCPVLNRLRSNWRVNSLSCKYALNAAFVERDRWMMQTIISYVPSRTRSHLARNTERGAGNFSHGSKRRRGDSGDESV